MDVGGTASNLGIGRDELLELLEVFLQASWVDFQALKEAMEESDRQRAAVAAHSLKGAALNLGFKEIAHLARTLELDAKNGEFSGVEGQLSDLRGKLLELERVFGF